MAMMKQTTKRMRMRMRRSAMTKRMIRAMELAMDGEHATSISIWKLTRK